MNKKTLLTILFFGSLWGATEAILGYLLHFIPLNLAGFVMFPVGFYFMYCSFKKTNEVSSMFFTGLVACAVKLFNLALPFLPVMKTIVPAVCILFECIFVFVFYKIFKIKQPGVYIAPAVLSSLSWRVMYLCFQFVIICFGASSIFTNGISVLVLNFVILQGSVNAAILIMLSRIEKKRNMVLTYKIANARIVFCTLFSSIFITVFFALI